MKYAKRFASLLLALVMVFALSVTAVATGTGTTGSITVDNPVPGQTYTAYKIFDVVYDTKTVNGETVAGDHYAYTIQQKINGNINPWFNAVTQFMSTDLNAKEGEAQQVVGTLNLKTGEYSGNGLTLTPSASDPAVYVVETTNAFSAPDFAKALQTKLKEESFTPSGTKLEVDATTGKPTATGLNLGYYFVASTGGALANLTTTNPSVTIHDKNDVPFEKVDDQESVDVGQTVNYTITGKVPDTTGFTTYTYKVTDMMTKGLTPNLTVDPYGKIATGVTIKVGNDENNVKTSEWTIKPIYGLYNENGAPTTTDSNGDTVTRDTAGAVVVGFTATIDLAPGGTAKYTVGQAITVTYSATVNEHAVAKIEKNHAVLTYSNDPTSNTTTDSQPEEEQVYSAKIVIDKYEKDNKDTKLAGAEFILYKRGEGVTTQPQTGDYDTVTENSTTTYYSRLYYKYTAATEASGDTTATPAKVEWDADRNNATVKTTEANGAASFDGIADGTYYLLETKAPAGYNLLKDPVTVTVNGAGATEEDLSTLTQTASVANNTGSLLPSTGGMGTTILYVVGAILVLCAGILLVVRRRMDSEE